MFPERSTVANSAKSVFFDDVNDIDIYIEDTAIGYEKIFSIIFSRVFRNKYNVEKVFPLGGRKAVLEEFNTCINDISRPSLFIIDGDLFLLSGDDVENKKGLYKLPFYCIENLLINEMAFSILLDEEEPIKSFQEVVSEFNFSEWLDVNQPLLFELFVEYAISFKVNQPEPTTSFKVNEIVADGKGNLDKDKTKKRIHDLRVKAQSVVGETLYIETRDEILKRFESQSLTKMDVISAKDYLFPLLTARFKSTVKSKISNINFRQRLAKQCSIESIQDSENYVAC
ncbi:DUF4435 domain-containing protein [Endozoicomonas acroporae]|uniref:DUF4435 domain-containing protein n=1 Tax=Endozoicomonas acroporae TaxID=1701104 RepID=UPI000C7574B8|nr:DUF4435 domain-containing protein [Endozoicomonas acroporae]